MFDIGWSEMMVVAVIALIVIGPKDLPRVLRTVGQWTRKARMLAREFQSGVDDMIREAELEDAKKALDSARHLNVQKAIEDTVDPTGAMKEEAREIAETAREESAETSKPKSKPAKAQAETGKGGADGAADGAADQAGDGKAAGATIVEQPVKVAPPHSVTPPKDETSAGKSEKTTEKTA